MQTYESLEDITVYIFFKILETEDYSFMIKSDEQRSKHLNEIQLFELEEKFKNIIYEYSSATQNFKILSNMKRRSLIKELEIKYNIMKSVIEIYEEHSMLEVLFVLDKLGFDFMNCESIEKEVKKVIKKAKGLKNKILINKIKYEQSNKNNNQESDKKYNLDLMALNLEKSVDLKYKIDVRETTMIRWINLINYSKKQKRS